MDQPFAHFVRQLFERQSYPNLSQGDGELDPPYDVSGWTLPLQMGVEVHEGREPLTADLRKLLRPVQQGAEEERAGAGADFDSPTGVGFDSHPVARAIVPPAGEITGNGPRIALDSRQNNSYRFLNRAWSAGAKVEWSPGTPGRVNDGQYEAGTSGQYLVSGLAEATAKQWVRDLALQARRTSRQGSEMAAPRVALFRPFRPSMDEGWSRWLLERWQVDFANVNDADLRAGNLAERFDVILLPSIRTSVLEEGWAKGDVPDRYVGGLGAAGARALDAFVRAGGTLVAINESTRYAIEALHLPVTDATADIDRKELFIGGSIVEMELDVAHPVMTGMAPRSAVFVAQSPVFEPGEGFEGRVLARYSEQGSPLLSGFLHGEEHVQGGATALQVRHGKGRVLLLGMRPQWRAQPFGTFKILFNALLTHGVAEGAVSEGFWQPSTGDD